MGALIERNVGLSERRVGETLVIMGSMLHGMAVRELGDPLSEGRKRMNLDIPIALKNAADGIHENLSTTVRNFLSLMINVDAIVEQELHAGRTAEVIVAGIPIMPDSPQQYEESPNYRFNLTMPAWEVDLVRHSAKKNGRNFSSFTRRALSFGVAAMQHARSQGHTLGIPIKVGQTQIAFIF